MRKLWLGTIHFKILKALEQPARTSELARLTNYDVKYVSSSTAQLLVAGYLYKQRNGDGYCRTRKGDEAAIGEPLTFGEFLVLSHLAQRQDGDDSVTMASALYMGLSTIGKPLRDLLTKQYVARGDRSRRGHVWSITDAGRIVLRANSL